MSRRGIAVATVLLAALGGLGLTPARAAAPTRLYLVTLEGPGQPGLLAGLRALLNEARAQHKLLEDDVSIIVLKRDDKRTDPGAAA